MDENSTGPSEAESLCISCGLCCSGAIFDRAKITSKELSSLEKLPVKLDFFSNGDKNALGLPCHALKKTGCSIYNDRPKVCGEYKCRTLRKLENGDHSKHEAQQKIARAKDQIARVNAALKKHGIDPGSKNTRQRLVRVTQMMRETDDPAKRRALGEISIELAGLVTLIRQYFKPDYGKSDPKKNPVEQA